MKFLSFKYNNAESYGVKVKREDAVWDLKQIFAEFGEGDFHPQTLLVYNKTKHLISKNKYVKQ